MSSDSEDDCYVSEKLQKMKNKYLEDKTETMNLLDDSAELDAIVKNCPLPPKNKLNKKKATKKKLNDTITTAESPVIELPSVSVQNNTDNSNKRVTRSRAKKVASEPAAAPAKAKKQKKNASVVENSDNILENTDNASENTDTTSQNAGNASTASQDILNVSGSSTGGSRGRRGRGRGRGTPRGRGRGRGTPRGRGRGRGRSRQRMWLPMGENLLMNIIQAMATAGEGHTLDPSIPTYSIGNTDEYPDQSDSQALFSSKKTTEDVVLVDDNDLDDNEELSVKVYWQNSEFFKFTIRKFQKFTQIFEYFAKKENVTHDKLLFTFNDKILKPEDTPDSIDYSIVKFIDGGIVTQAVTDLGMQGMKDEVKDGIKLKFQCQNLKKPFEIRLGLDDKLFKAMLKCAEHLEKPLDKLKFEFDGDSISGKSTAREQEFEGGECIDVRILS